MNTLNVALIGAGRMARTHANVLGHVGYVSIQTVCDAAAENAAALAEFFGAHATTSLDEVLHDDGITAVIITTPTATHADLISKVAHSGKHIFVEKPVAHTLEAADHAVQAVEAAGVQCQVGFQRRYDPSYLEAKRKIERGELGTLEGFRGLSRDAFLPPVEFLKTSGGLMVDMGIHDLDSARYFVGEVEEVYCIGAVHAEPELRDYGLFDSAVATLRFANGALGTIESGLRTAYGYEVRAEILGDGGRLHLERDSRYHLRQYGKVGGFYERPADFEAYFHEAYAAEIRTFANNVHQGKPVTPNAADARESLRLALATQHSLETGTIVKVSTFGEVHP
ncbi:MAG: Gfo/Idh/MocA family oxidoreductase [Trueperaceae bacterium]|nr:MAG: Gfo/Idh/MocA family oxidoreductase [Trueperaceae bacterium]